MKLMIERNIVISNPETRDFLADSFYIESTEPLPIVFFVHGYKGYKDWGAWDLMALEFAKAGYFFVKFNFSHNGTTLERPSEFANLEAFGLNNFTKELSDYHAVISHFTERKEVNSERIAITGHSRGGGITVLQAFEDERVKVLVTMAGVCNFGYRFPTGDRMKEWEEKGVMYSENARTGQQMPHDFQLYQNYKENEERLNIQYAAQHLEKPFLIVHPAEDETVKEKEAFLLHEWCKASELKMIPDANHSFGSSEPWDEDFLPEHLEAAVAEIIEYLKKKL